MPFFPWPPLLALLVLAYVVFTALIDPKNGQQSLIYDVVIVAVSAAYYRFVLRRRGVWTLRAPTE